MQELRELALIDTSSKGGSTVTTDAMVERAQMALTGRDRLGPEYANDAKRTTHEERRDMLAALSAAMQATSTEVGGREPLAAQLHNPYRCRGGDED
ncbi:hypothetical protein [Stenotrophomonas pictorum]|uniref:hypothetical protein n=1 Tax=Stenotrophomonas pictorum TaxID=86184 RepID=UPI0011AE85B6|nr:hypothetical protein [Stenotrophomonas pictorum]